MSSTLEKFINKSLEEILSIELSPKEDSMYIFDNCDLRFETRLIHKIDINNITNQKTLTSKIISRVLIDSVAIEEFEKTEKIMISKENISDDEIIARVEDKMVFVKSSQKIIDLRCWVTDIIYDKHNQSFSITCNNGRMTDPFDLSFDINSNLSLLKMRIIGEYLLNDRKRMVQYYYKNDIPKYVYLGSRYTVHGIGNYNKFFFDNGLEELCYE